MKRVFLLTILFFSCGGSEEIIETSITDNSAIESIEEVTTTTIPIGEVEVEQINSFKDALFTIDEEKSLAKYLAPKVFLNSNEEIVVGVTNLISGTFEVSIGECDSSDSCIQIKNLRVSADLRGLKSSNGIRDNAIKSKWLESEKFPIAIYTIDELILPNKNFDSKIEETVSGILRIRDIEYLVPFSISAYMTNDTIFVYGVTQVETLWFGFDPPSKFEAWDVLNPIGIEVEIVASR